MPERGKNRDISLYHNPKKNELGGGIKVCACLVLLGMFFLDMYALSNFLYFMIFVFLLWVFFSGCDLPGLIKIKIATKYEIFGPLQEQI